MRVFGNWDSTQKKSLVSVIEEKMKLSRTPLKERIAHAIYKLESQLSKLQQTSGRLQQRDKEMFERCVGAKLGGDPGHATIYANECVEIRKMAKIILASELALERVILRLKTVEEVGDVLVQMAPVVGVVRETKGKLSGIIPEVSHELEDINTILSDALLETGEATVRDMTLEATTAEARSVLEEAAATAEEKLGERFPDLPVWKEEEVPHPAEGVAVPSERTLESAVVEAGSVSHETLPSGDTSADAAPAQIEPTLDDDSIDKLVLDYLTACAGNLSIRQCSEALQVTPEAVRRAVARLSEAGKISCASS